MSDEPRCVTSSFAEYDVRKYPLSGTAIGDALCRAFDHGKRRYNYPSLREQFSTTHPFRVVETWGWVQQDLRTCLDMANERIKQLEEELAQ